MQCFGSFKIVKRVTSIPGWDDFSARLKEDLNYSETMLERTFYTDLSSIMK